MAQSLDLGTAVGGCAVLAVPSHLSWFLGGLWFLATQQARVSGCSQPTTRPGGSPGGETPLFGGRNPDLGFHRFGSLLLGITFPHLQGGRDVPATLYPV